MSFRSSTTRSIRALAAITLLGASNAAFAQASYPGKPLRLICHRSVVMLNLGVTSQTKPSVVLADFSDLRSGLPLCTKVGATPLQIGFEIAVATPAAVKAAQRAKSSTVAPPKAAIEAAPFSADDGARKPSA